MRIAASARKRVEGKGGVKPLSFLAFYLKA